MIQRFRRGALSLGVVTGVCVVLVGSATSLLGARQTASTAPRPQQPVFRADVQLVTTDVIVRDRDGRFVPDLGVDDFMVFEDGQPQEIASLLLVHGGRVFNVQAPPTLAAPEGIILPTSRPVATAPGRIFLLFVDDFHLHPLDTPHVRAVLKQITSTLIHEGDLFALFTTGPSAVTLDMSYDRRLLESLISRIKGNGLSVADIIEGPQGREGPGDLRFRAHTAFATAYDLMRQLEQVEHRRKAVIYVSNGYDFDPFPAGRQGTDQIFGRPYGLSVTDAEYGNPFLAIAQRGNRFADLDLTLELGELTRAANRANASFYTIDVRGLVGAMDAGRQLDPTEWIQHVRKTQQTLRLLAEATGGLAVVNTNDFESALRQIDAETSDYYMLGYYASNTDPSHRIRRIEITTSDPDLIVRSREWYSMDAPAATESARQEPAQPEAERPDPPPAFSDAERREPAQPEAERPDPRRAFSDAEQAEARVLVSMADAIAGGALPGGDAFLRWRSHFLQAPDGQTYVPFTIEVDEAPGVFETAAMYVRVAERGDTRTRVERVPQSGTELRPGDTVPVNIPERDFLPPGTPTAAGAAAALVLAERAERAKETLTYPFEDFHFVELPPVPAGQPRIVRRALVVPAGSYDVYVALRERPAGAGTTPKHAVLMQPLDVPDFSGASLATSSLILADGVEVLSGPLPPDAQAARPYALGGTEILPARGTRFTSDQSLTVTFLVYNVALDAGGKPDVRVTYNFYNQGDGGFFNRTAPQEFSAQTLPEAFDMRAGHALAPIQEVALGAFPSGVYTMQVVVSDERADATVTQSLQFAVDRE